MLTEDYLMRMINLALAALLRAIGLRKAGQYEDAQQAIDVAVESLLGLRADLVRRMDDSSLLAMLSGQGAPPPEESSLPGESPSPEQAVEPDLPRLEVLADLFQEEAMILASQNRVGESALSSLRALNFYLECALGQAADQVSQELDRKIRAADRSLAGKRLPEVTLYKLLSFFEGAGDEGRARAIREELANL